MIKKIKCPLCNHENKVSLYLEDLTLEIIRCNSDEGGCDKDFAIEPKVTVEVTVFTLEKVKV